eukprot:COSAG06_NODE_2373_length_6989_cov_8.425399_3_plen_87_part_00
MSTHVNALTLTLTLTLATQSARSERAELALEQGVEQMVYVRPSRNTATSDTSGAGAGDVDVPLCLEQHRASSRMSPAPPRSPPCLV